MRVVQMGNAFDSYVGSVWLFFWCGHGNVRQEGGLGPRQQGGGMAQFHRNVEVSLPKPLPLMQRGLEPRVRAAIARCRVTESACGASG